MLEGLLHVAGFENVASKFDKDTVLKAAGDQLDYVAAKRLEQGKLTNWDRVPVAKILDWVFGCDVIIDSNGRGDYYAIDATMNPSKVVSKLSVVRNPNRQAMLAALGISKVAVVLFTTSNSEWGWALASDEVKLTASDDLIDKVVIPLSEDARSAVDYHIYLG